MRGPPPTPTHLKLIRGNPGQRANSIEPEPQVPQELPEPPHFLSEDAKGEWRRIIEEMVRLKLVTASIRCCSPAIARAFRIGSPPSRRSIGRPSAIRSCAGS